MAIVFVSPREKQKVFILAIAGFFLIALVLIGLGVFFARPKATLVEEVFVAPKIRINFDVLKSPQIQALELLPEIEKQFNYKAETAKKRIQTGMISASSQEAAIQILTSLGLSSIIVTEITGGRTDPFSPYYDITKTAPKKGTK